MRLRWFEPNTCHASLQVRPGLRTGPDACPGAVPGPFPVPVGQLWARSGQVSGLRPARPRLPEGADAHRGPLPSEECSRRSRPCCGYLPGLAGSGCVSWRVAVCGRLADGIWPGDYRISWASCGPHGVPGYRHRAGTMAVTEGEYPPGGTAVRLAHNEVIHG